jgi:hypothetical protein
LRQWLGDERIAKSSADARRAFWRGTVQEFFEASPAALLGQLTSRNVGFHAAADAERAYAWAREIEILSDVLSSLADAAEWGC